VTRHANIEDGPTERHRLRGDLCDQIVVTVVSATPERSVGRATVYRTLERTASAR
jgi:hypothetical protein